MTREFLYNFIKQHSLAVISTVSAEGLPESAVIGIAVTAEIEIVFDTVTSSRKYQNLRGNSRVALVIGWDDETTVQYEGIAEELPKGDNDYKEVYYATFPDGRERAEKWSRIAHFKVKPGWIRYSNFSEPGKIEEIIL